MRNLNMVRCCNRSPPGRAYSTSDLRRDLAPSSAGYSPRGDPRSSRNSGKSISFSYDGRWPLRVEFRTMLMVGSALTSIVDPLYYKVRLIAQIV